jgi:hypothetical protein
MIEKLNTNNFWDNARFINGRPKLILFTEYCCTSVDVGVSSIVSPNSGVNLGSSEPVVIKIKNHGANSVFQYSLEC